MFRGLNTGEMTPEERMRELAEILARGYLRLLKKATYLGNSAPETEGGNAATSDISNGCDWEKSTG